MVEVLDRVFENVCELDIVFHIDRVHYVLNEFIQAGLVLETNVEKIVALLQEQARLEKIDTPLIKQGTVNV